MKSIYSLMVIGLMGISSSQASISFTYATDAVGTPTGATWTQNDGTIQNSIDSTTTGTDTAIIDFTSIEGTFVDLADPTGNAQNNGGLRVASDLAFTMEADTVGGTADLLFSNTTSSAVDDNTGRYDSARFTGMSGVTELRVKFTFSDYLAGRDDSIQGQNNSARFRPLLAGLAIFNEGGLTSDDYNISMEFDQVFSSANTVNFVSGAAGFSPFATDGSRDGDSDPVTAGHDGFETISVDGLTFETEENDPYLQNGYFLNRGWSDEGTYDATDAQQVYAQSVTFVITADIGETFSDTSLFVFSLDGEQYTNLANVPEPTAFTFLGLGVAGALLRRRR